MNNHFEEAVKMARNLFMTVQPNVGYGIFSQKHQILLVDNSFRGIIKILFSLKTYQIIPFKFSHCSQFD